MKKSAIGLDGKGREGEREREGDGIRWKRRVCREGKVTLEKPFIFKRLLEVIRSFRDFCR